MGYKISKVEAFCSSGKLDGWKDFPFPFSHPNFFNEFA